MMFDNFKARCSRINAVMAENPASKRLTELQIARMKELEDKPSLTEKQGQELALLRLKEENSKEVLLSTTYIEYLMEVYAWETEGCIPINKETLETPQMRKGKLGEREAGILLSMVDGELYAQDKDRIYNDYLSGEVDFYLGKSIYEATNVTDIKNSFDYPTFLKKLHTGLENGQEQQVQGYLDITGAPVGYIANCLISMPEEMIEDEKYRLLRKLNVVTEENPVFKEKWAIYLQSINFERIDPRLRVSKIKIEPMSPIQRQFLYDQVQRGRDFLNKFHQERLKIVQ